MRTGEVPPSFLFLEPSMHKERRNKMIVTGACLLLPVLAWAQYDLVGGDCSSTVSMASSMGVMPIRSPRVLSDEEHAAAAKCVLDGEGMEKARVEREEAEFLRSEFVLDY